MEHRPSLISSLTGANALEQVQVGSFAGAADP